MSSVNGGYRRNKVASGMSCVSSVTRNQRSTLFDGVNGWVDLGEPADITLDLSTHEITMAAWVYVTDLSANRYVLAKARPFFPAVNWILGLSLTTGTVFGYWSDVAKTTSGATSVSVNTWHQVALTVRNIGGTFTGNVWLDGVVQGSNVVSLTTVTEVGTTARIGAGRAGAASALPFKGNIDEVTFWSVGFTGPELIELYNGGIPAAPKGHSRASTLLHHYSMGDNDAYPLLTDLAGTATGTATNMTSSLVNFVTTVI